MPALRSGLKPRALRSCTVIAVMICCSVNALPPTTMVCAATVLARATAASTTAMPTVTPRRMLFIVPPRLSLWIPRRIDAARHEPILRLTEQEIHDDGKQRRRQGAGQHHRVVLQVDAG